VNEQQQDRFEAELRRTRPARVPDELMAKLTAARPCAEPVTLERNHPKILTPAWWLDWRRLAPALAAALAGLLVVRANWKTAIVNKAAAPAAYGFKANDVQVDREFVSDFDVVAKLPSGEPVRFHCQKWNDQVVVTDTNRGMEIVQDNPRIEVVPVRFETY
jgi:hypothetical protein